MEYKDFWIKIESRVETGYRVSVIQSPAGGGTDTLPLRMSADGSTAALPDLGTLVRGTTPDLPGETHRDIEQAIAGAGPSDVGQDLFDALFAGTVRSLFDKSLGMVQAQGQGLRVKLQIDPEDAHLGWLATLPWEMLYFHGTREYLSLSEFTPVVRYLDVQRPLELPPFVEPLRVLVVLANPQGTDGLNLDKERTLIEDTWAQLENVEVDIVPHASRAMLLKALERTPYHVLHYMGHGGFDEQTGQGVLLMEGAEGAPEPINGQALGVLLRDVPTMRLVFLNACETARAASEQARDPFAGVASALVMAGMPAVLAMQFAITDRAAIAFAEGFYTALIRQQPVDAAVAAGRKGVHDARPGSLEWATPVLFMRAPDGYLFKPKRPFFTTKRTWALVVGGLVALLIAAAGVVLTASKPISLDPDALRLANGRIAELTALSNGKRVTPDAWTTSDPAVATVVNGRVEARAVGTAVITASLGWFSKGHTEVTVFHPEPARVRLARRSASMQAGDTLFIPASVQSEDGFALDGHPVTWSADDTSLVHVLPDGALVGREPTDRTRTVVRVTAAGGLTDSLLLTVNRRTASQPPAPDSLPPGDTGPILTRFALSETSTFLRAQSPMVANETYYSSTAAFAVGAPCPDGDCWYAGCDVQLADPDVLRSLMVYTSTGDPSQLDDPDARTAFTRRFRQYLLVAPGLTPLSARLQYSASIAWADIESPTDRDRVRGVVAACTPPKPTDALVFSVILKNGSATYLNVTDVRYVVLEDGGEAGGGAGAGVLAPLATYVHPITRECDLMDDQAEVYAFSLSPVIEIAPGRSAAFELQPSFTSPETPWRFLAPLRIRIDIVTDEGTVGTAPFWVEGQSCAG